MSLKHLSYIQKAQARITSPLPPSNTRHHYSFSLLSSGNAVLRCNNNTPVSSSTKQQQSLYSLQFHRSIVHAHYAPIAPRPPPREYEPDGTLRRYSTNAYFYDHGIHWVRWHFRAAGVFHIFYEGDCSEEHAPKTAYRDQFRWWAQFIPLWTIGVVVGSLIFSSNTTGICPQAYTQDWIEAMRERDRAENSYPFTRYLDRRRKERGPHWLQTNIQPTTPNWSWQSGQRDTAFLRAKAIKARKVWLEQEERRKRIEEQDRELEESLDENADDLEPMKDDEELPSDDHDDDDE